MSKNNKKMLSAAFIERFQDIFRCPVCHSQMNMTNFKSLICNNRHCFDLAKHGYVNLLSRANKTKYVKRMFEYRRTISRSGFFDPLKVVISHKIINQLRMNEPASILDAGCGEGSLLTNIQEEIFRSADIPLLAVGIDNSKEGIITAAAEFLNAIWCVADIANCPFANNQFNFILNILSPANYLEFHRLIKEDGVVIKVIPERDYLQELRDIFYKDSEKQAYSNVITLEHFYESFEKTEVETVRYQVNLDKRLIKPLLGMTPLTWGIPTERLNKIQEMNLQQVTMDFKILIGIAPS